ncbi:MAG TPA: hypothetical protein VFR17_06485 [Mycobacterium sp.]|nr:hypothetical protein [Mycobacterium sp.]
MAPAGGAHPEAASQRPTETPLVVGDHREVELVNLGGAPGRALLARIAPNIGPAVDAIEAFWGTDWSHQIVVTATGSDRQFAAEAGGGNAGQWSDVAAVAVADRVDPRRRFAVGQRIVFAPGAAAMSGPALRIVLTHELFHYATRTDTAVDAPRWLTEGVADFVARPHPTPDDRPAPPLTLPTDAGLDGPQRTQAYERAWWFAAFVADRYGTAGLRELYLAACGPGHPAAPVAVRQTLGTGLSEVLADWQGWMAR